MRTASGWHCGQVGSYDAELLDVYVVTEDTLLRLLLLLLRRLLQLDTDERVLFRPLSYSAASNVLSRDAIFLLDLKKRLTFRRPAFGCHARRWRAGSLRCWRAGSPRFVR